MKKKILSIAILSIVLISAMFSAYPIVEVQATENQVSLSGGGKKYYGVFVAGTGKGLRKSWQESSYRKSRSAWREVLIDEGEGWDRSRTTSLDNPTKAALEAAISRWKTEVKAGDEFHFYFAGHGNSLGQILLDDGNYDGFQLAIDALSGFNKSVTISVVLDCCWSHKVIERARNFIFQKDEEGKSRHIEKTHLALLGTTTWYYPLSFSIGPWGNLGTAGLIKIFRDALKSVVYAKSVFEGTCIEIYNMSEGNQDGDGLIDEDGGVLGDYNIENCILGEDDDGDGTVDEDPPTQQGSYIADPSDEHVHAFAVKLPNGGQYMEVTPGGWPGPYDKFNITVEIQNVTEMTAFGVTIVWNSTFCNATENYWMSDFFKQKMMAGEWSVPCINYISNDAIPAFVPNVGVFEAFGMTALSPQYNVTGDFDLVTIEFHVNTYGPSGFYIWKTSGTYEDTLPPGIFTPSGWFTATTPGESEPYEVVWAPGYEGQANAIVMVELPPPYSPSIENKDWDPDFPLVCDTVTISWDCKPGFDGVNICPVTDCWLGLNLPGGALLEPPVNCIPDRPQPGWMHCESTFHVNESGVWHIAIVCCAPSVPDPPSPYGEDICQTFVVLPITAVGGKATPINIPMNKPETPTLWIWLSIIFPLIATALFVKLKKKKQ